MAARRISFSRAIFAFLILLGSAAVVQASCRADVVHLRGDWGEARFAVEVADDARERQLGLMNRESMPASAGMLFVYHQTRVVSFWMKNTLIPLDMIFLDESGRVVKVHERARPHDLTSISSDEPARYVLEINAGLSRALGIDAGTELRHPSVLQHLAAWPCREAN
jgi:uncharacterized membrane protein (UPF0127 family)